MSYEGVSTYLHNLCKTFGILIKFAPNFKAEQPLQCKLLNGPLLNFSDIDKFKERLEIFNAYDVKIQKVPWKTSLNSKSGLYRGSHFLPNFTITDLLYMSMFYIYFFAQY